MPSDQMLRPGGKSVLAGGYVGDQPVVIKMPGQADSLWRSRQRHEIGVYLIFAQHPPPVRVPRLLHTYIISTPDGESALLDWEFTGLFLPGFDLAMLRILLAGTQAAAGHIEAIVAETGQLDAYLVNLAVVLSRERHIHRELPEDHPLRVARLPALEDPRRAAGTGFAPPRAARRLTGAKAVPRLRGG
jgi:hypothetical protein